ncbi:MAG: alpha/beta hydrolase, partial [Planctomycetota bacterium]|nr:alpha/beta hydrolase [Planctomycetota bacterium]
GLGALLTRGLNLFAGLAAKSTTIKPLSRETIAGYLLPYNSWKNRIGIHSFIKEIPLAENSPSYKLFQEIENAAAQKLADKPMLIQWGMRDWCFTPLFLKLWRRRFPKAAVNELQAGHYLLEDAGPEAAARLKSFLEEPIP